MGKADNGTAETPEPEGDTEAQFEKFTDLTRRLLAVPKSETNGKRSKASRSVDPK